MSSDLLLLQVVAVVFVVAANLLSEIGLPWLRRCVWPRVRQRLISEEERISEEEQERVAPVHLPWYWIAPVETGILEVALAMTAAAMALPAFAQPGIGTPPYVVWGFQIALLLSASLAALSTVWLYRIYVRQLRSPTTVRGAADPDAQNGGNPLSVRQSGPYSLLAYAMILLLISLALLPLMVTL
ncbi:MAG: hypothetical protein H5T64_03740 [Chloroflexi bacterium]|nr:hypothetical protein [Chloroflexota bacterium]